MSFVRAILRRVGPPIRRFGPIVAVLIAFFGARLYARIKLGAQFDSSPLGHFLQFVDKDLLRTELWKTLFYLQHQAPFLNFLSGVALKISEKHYGLLLDGCFFVGALALTVSLFSILKSLGVRPWLAALGTIVYTVSPPVIFYELWLMYHHFVTVFLTLSIALLLRFLRKETLGSGIAFFCMLSLVVLTRATFGLVFMGSIAGVLLWYRPVARKLVLKAAAGPMLFILLYTIKTPLQTGHSLGTALVGPNLVQKTLHEIPARERERLFRVGAISPMEKLEPFPNLTRHPEFRAPNVPETGVVVLDRLENANGDINPNALQYIYIADIAMKEAKYLIRNYPDAYLRSVASAFFIGYFHGATNDICAPRSPAYKSIVKFDTKLTKFLRPQKHEALLGLEIILPLSLLYAFSKLISPRSGMASRRSLTPTVAVILITILYAASSLLISYADFSRYRFEVDVLYTMLFTMLVDDALSRVVAWAKRAVRWVKMRRAPSRWVLSASEPKLES